MMLADAVEKTNVGKFKDFVMTEDERYGLYITAWLHDCGKVTTVHIVDKATKLETIYDRVENIQTRFEVLKRDAEIEYLKQKLAFSRNEDIEGIKDIEASINFKFHNLKMIWHCRKIKCRR